MAHAIDQLRPSLVVWENVKGALSANAFSLMEPGTGRLDGGANQPVLRALGRVLGDLTNLGYDSRWTTLRASSVGAPHRRERVFVVAYPQGDQGWFSDRNNGSLANPDSDLFGEYAGESFAEERPGPTESDGFEDSGGRSPLALFSTPQARDGKGVPGDGYNLASLPRDIALLRTPCAAEADGGPLHPDVAKERGQTLRLTGQILALTGDLLPTPDVLGDNRKSPGYDNNGVNFHNIVTNDLWGEYMPAIHRWEQVLGRPVPSPKEPSASGKPRLSAPFVEWMMGLPVGWVTGVPGLSRVAQLRALGNGVVPQQAASAVETLLVSAWAESRSAA
jgi:DNA (cytosine-5)-methyltransferase 1